MADGGVLSVEEIGKAIEAKGATCDLASPRPPKFREGELCTKCGSPRLRVRWVEFVPAKYHGLGVAGSLERPEHLAIECRRCGYKFDRAPLDLPAGSIEEPWPLLNPAKDRPSQEDLDRRLFVLAESVRLKNALEAADLETLGDLASLTEHEFRSVRMVGNASVSDAKRILERWNLRFRRPGEKVLRPKGGES